MKMIGKSYVLIILVILHGLCVELEAAQSTHHQTENESKEEEYIEISSKCGEALISGGVLQDGAYTYTYAGTPVHHIKRYLTQLCAYVDDPNSSMAGNVFAFCSLSSLEGTLQFIRVPKSMAVKIWALGADIDILKETIETMKHDNYSGQIVEQVV